MKLRIPALLIPVLSIGVLILAACDARSADDNGYQVVRSAIPFGELEGRLKDAITKAGMNLVNRASASDGAKGRGLQIKGDVVIGVFRNDFAVRMLEANVDAGIEAPIRLHLTEEADGTASIRFYRPSTVFGHYSGEAIKALGIELDPMVDAIIRAAIGPK